MILILILFASGFLYGFITHKPKEAKQACTPCEIVTLYDAKQAERGRKEAARVAQARRDIETQTERVRLLDALLDNAKAKYERATKDREIERLTKQIISLEGQIAAAENKIEKAKFIVKYGG